MSELAKNFVNAVLKDYLYYATVTQLAEKIHCGDLSPVNLTEHLLERIEQLNTTLRAYITVTPERALKEAQEAKDALNEGNLLGPLHGVPYAVKDIFDVKGLPTTAGTNILSDNFPFSDCSAVKRLKRAGMILLGKTYTSQLAADIIGINHNQGTPHNPWAENEHIPGGSSSGSAVAVASGLAPMALGSDTAGSVRTPASLCGTVGLKTTVGRISRNGVYPLCWSLDTVGLLTRSVEDAALIYDVLKGTDSGDVSTFNVPDHSPKYSIKAGIKNLKITFGETILFDDIDPEIEKTVRESGEVFHSLGAKVSSMEIPEFAEANSIDWWKIFSSESYYLNRNLIENHSKELDSSVQWMVGGQKTKAVDYFQMLRYQTELKRKLSETLSDVDAIISPTTALPAIPIKTVDSNSEAYEKFKPKYMRNTQLGNFLNLCAVSLPCGFSSKGFPIGLMIYAKPFKEEIALRIAYAYENATNWHNHHPSLFK